MISKVLCVFEQLTVFLLGIVHINEQFSYEYVLSHDVILSVGLHTSSHHELYSIIHDLWFAF